MWLAAPKADASGAMEKVVIFGNHAHGEDVINTHSVWSELCLIFSNAAHEP